MGVVDKSTTPRARNVRSDANSRPALQAARRNSAYSSRQFWAVPLISAAALLLSGSSRGSFEILREGWKVHGIKLYAGLFEHASHSATLLPFFGIDASVLVLVEPREVGRSHCGFPARLTTPWTAASATPW